MRDIHKGGKEYVGMLAQGKEPFNIISAFCRVRDAWYEEVDEGPAYIDGKNVFFLIDTEKEGYQLDSEYYALFSATIEEEESERGEQVIKDYVPFRVVR